jgi:hypothetical protein
MTLDLIAGCMGGPCFGGASEPMGQFGAYHERNKQLRLADGETLTVYRVKHWQFGDGSPPALQLEYASPVPVTDSASVRRLAIRIWPAFAPYVEEQGLRTGILTATNLEKVGTPGAWVARTHHYGLIAERDSAGAWHFQGQSEALPPAERSGLPRIFEANGEPLRMGAPPRS